MIHRARANYNETILFHRELMVKHLVPEAHSHSGCATLRKQSPSKSPGLIEQKTRNRPRDFLIHRCYAAMCVRH
jgi:hypothetical protein